MKALLGLMLDVRSFEAKNWGLEFDHQYMNRFELARSLKNDVRVCSMFNKMVFDPSLHEIIINIFTSKSLSCSIHANFGHDPSLAQFFSCSIATFKSNTLKTKKLTLECCSEEKVLDKVRKRWIPYFQVPNISDDLLIFHYVSLPVALCSAPLFAALQNFSWASIFHSLQCATSMEFLYSNQANSLHHKPGNKMRMQIMEQMNKKIMDN